MPKRRWTAEEKMQIVGTRGQDLTIRSDNGCQMTCKRFVKELRDWGITHERTGYSNPDANALIERWFCTLKEEAVWLTECRNFDEARRHRTVYPFLQHRKAVFGPRLPLTS